MKIPDHLRMPSKQALEVFALAYENHKGDLPFDGRLIPNQWLLNERATNVGIIYKLICELEKKLVEK